jgi:hypothetical protein
MLKRWTAWLRHNRRVIGLAAVIIGVLAIAWALLVPAADWLATHDVGQVAAKVRPVQLQTARDAARGRLLTLGAGVLAAGALWFTARTFALSREGQVTDRYTKAIEQLGSDKPEVRTGGIYALDRVIRDSPRDHHNVMAVLSAFIRQQTIRQQSRREQAEHNPSSDRVRLAPADIQAAIRVIGHRDKLPGYQGKPDVLNLTGANLTNTDADDANLSHAWLHDADFTRASAPRAKFIEAHLRRANFTHANLTNANLTGAKLEYADLTSANLTSANLTGADLTGADLTGVDLTRANLIGSVFPEEWPFPEGWVRDPHSRRLRIAEGWVLDPDPAARRLRRASKDTGDAAS